MYFAVVRVQYRKARGLGSKQIKRPVKYSFGHFCEVGSGVDVVGDLKQRFGDARLAFLLGIDMSVAITYRDLLGKILDEAHFLFVPMVTTDAMMKSDHPEQLKVESHRHDQHRLAAQPFDKLKHNRRQIRRSRVFDNLRA